MTCVAPQVVLHLAEAAGPACLGGATAKVINEFEIYLEGHVGVVSLAVQWVGCSSCIVDVPALMCFGHLGVHALGIAVSH